MGKRPSGPLVDILGATHHEGAFVHELVCGHRLAISADNAAIYRRRCFKCRQGKPQEFDPAAYIGSPIGGPDAPT